MAAIHTITRPTVTRASRILASVAPGSSFSPSEQGHCCGQRSPRLPRQPGRSARPIAKSMGDRAGRQQPPFSHDEPGTRVDRKNKAPIPARRPDGIGMRQRGRASSGADRRTKGRTRVPCTRTRRGDRSRNRRSTHAGNRSRGCRSRDRRGSRAQRTGPPARPTPVRGRGRTRALRGRPGVEASSRARGVRTWARGPAAGPAWGKRLQRVRRMQTSVSRRGGTREACGFA